jgi:hypothetical protein
MKEIKIKELIDIAGPITEISLDEFGWLVYTNGAPIIAAKDGLFFVFRYFTEFWMPDSPGLIKLASFENIAYTRSDATERYLEYNARTNKVRFIEQIPDVVHERDECYYAFVVRTESYNSRIVYDAIKKKMEEKK